MIQRLLLGLLCMSMTLIGYAQKPAKGLTEGVHSKVLFDKSMNKDISCYRIPALATAPNGDLLAAIDERVPSCGDLHLSDDINIVLRRSTDHGKTWTPIETVVDFPKGRSASDPSIIVDRETQEIFLFYNYMDVVNEHKVYYLQYVKSSDNGKTWSDPVDITDQITLPDWRNAFKFITSGRGIQTRNGWLLHCLTYVDKGVFVFGSKDHGKTWFLNPTLVEPGDESKIVELENGNWMINSRVKGGGKRYVHISSDNGQTWQSKIAQDLDDPACNASIIRYTSTKDGYSKNRLIFSNANSSNKRKNMTVKISYDEGKTWSTGKTIYTGPSAYSSMTVLENGEIGLFFEKDNYDENTFVSFSLEWLTEGQDRLNK